LLWTYDGVDEWLPLARAAQYPGFSNRFDQHAPSDAKGFSPPFLSRSLQPGGLQIWTGCIASTAPGWSLLVRGVANLSKSTGYETLEGIIETDHWFGPLFDNIRILKTDIPIEFRSDIPFLQVQLVRQDVYDEKFLRNFVVKQLHELDDERIGGNSTALLLRPISSRKESADSTPYRFASGRPRNDRRSRPLIRDRRRSIDTLLCRDIAPSCGPLA
jgi:hypothetical protein